MDGIDEQLRRIYGDRRWIIAVGAAAAAIRTDATLKDWGCETLVVAALDGVGDLPDAPIVRTNATAGTIVGGIRAFFESVEHPTPEIQAAVDAFDPDRSTRVLAEPYATATRMVGRPTFGVRRPAWAAWEDKLRVDALWDELDIPHAPYRIVDVTEAGTAAIELATDRGTVWVGDNSRGWHGGGDLVRWVSDPARIPDQVAWFAQHADRVRVMPFLDGLPCSIHGWVTGSGVATFLPCEILILRNEDHSGFGYAGVATTWVAPDAATVQMKDVARRVGARLRSSDGYLGPFGIDGILTTDGFRPTELNPRMSVGAGIQLAGAPVPLGLAMRAEIEGLIEIDHVWLEDLALGSRAPSLHFGMPISSGGPNTALVGIKDGSVIDVSDEDESVGRVSLGPSTNGMYLRGELKADAVAPGAPGGALVAAVINFATEQWSLDLPRYVPAPLLEIQDPRSKTERTRS